MRVRAVLAAALAVTAFTSVAPAHAAPVAPHVSAPSSVAKSVGWHVPWAVGGPKVVNGAVVDSAPDRPDAPVRSVRLWDTRTAWLNLEPRKGQFDWTNLDRHLTAATDMGATDVTLVLAGTPSWAADTLDGDAAPWLGPGSNRPAADPADWVEYVTAVATRYRGKIHAYELGNEPNLAWFWTGTPQQFARLVADGAAAIRAVDPDAVIVAGGPVTATSAFTPSIATWTDAYLEALGALSAPVDAYALHYYPKAWPKRGLRPVTDEYRRVLAAHGVSGGQIWVTEVNTYDSSRSCIQVKRSVSSTLAPQDRAWLYGYGADVAHPGMRVGDSACVAA